MSPVVDETAGDLPVRDVGQMRGGLMPAHADAVSNVKPWKKHHVMISKDPQRLFRLPRDQLEDLCLHVQEENVVLRKHTQAQGQKMRRMSTRLLRLRQARPGSSGAKEKEMEDALQELESRVATLERQKVVLHNKLSLAKQHILDLGGRTSYRFNKGKGTEVDGEVGRATRTAPPRCCPRMEDTREDLNKFGLSEQMRMTDLELTARTLRDTLREKEREMEGTVREMKRQQAERHRINIRENVDVICLQKQLSEKSATLRVTQEKIADLQQVYEKQLEEVKGTRLAITIRLTANRRDLNCLTQSQRSMREGQTLLLEKAEELNEQLKQERDRALTLEAQLTTANLSRQTLGELRERIRDLQGEKDRIKESYDSLLESTLSTYGGHEDQCREVIARREEPEDGVLGLDVQFLTEALRTEKEQRSRLQLETEKLRHEKEILEERHKAKLEHLEEEVLQYKEQISGLQNRLDSVTKFDMSPQELSETLLRIKAFRMQQETREGLRFLEPEGTKEDLQLTDIQASHAETVLELQKTRSLLLLEHHISKDLQGEVETMKKRLESERKEVRMAMEERDKVLSKKALQINSLQAQLKAFAYSTKNHQGTMPIQYTWPAGDQELVQPFEDDIFCAPLRLGESLLELHIKGGTFTPGGLRNMGGLYADQAEDMVTFCTYGLLDFEVHSTPLARGSQPKYSFTSRYALTVHDLGRLRVQGSRVRVELHQAIGGVRFVTHGSGYLSLVGAIERKGECTNGSVNITGSEGELVGVVDFWARLFPPAEPTVAVAMKDSDGNAPRQTRPTHVSRGWREGGRARQELYDYGSGIPNELLLLLEHCEGLRGQWPGMFPDAYLTYRLYDLQPHVSKTVRGTADPIFHDTASYPLAITADVLRYLRSSHLWVYVFDDSDDQIPSAYLAKTPIPLRALATGKEIMGDYVLRDPAGGPRGTVRVLIKWKYPFRPPADAAGGSEGRREEAQGSRRPVAKPKVKPTPDCRKPNRTKRSDRRSLGRHDGGPCTSLSASSDSPPMSKSQETSSVELRLRKSSAIETGPQNIPSVDVVSVDEVEETKDDVSQSAEEPSESSNTSTCDLLIIPPRLKTRRGHKVRVEILSLTLEPSSNVALDRSVQRVYVEYRLLGVPMETTETPVSLRKPTAGEEIHYNFTRVIYVDGSLSVPLRQYLYTMLEGTDPNEGRLKFTIVSEPMDDDEECADVGYAFLDLQELLLTGNDVTERQIDIVRVDREQEVIGFLKVSLKAAKALSCIYEEFRRPEDAEGDGERREDRREKVEQRRRKNPIRGGENDNSDF
ncbi:protein fantom isoform X2 [Syngnathoides biaculeatus]|uniref:protein fantom isoform X2 n=1 Tax=Syngnathoides biaculeatus TaxID=300417 RepID=UPI002ADE6017|nr:protein fantom isoform X2 [Syngnathoides biaculeatus]